MSSSISPKHQSHSSHTNGSISHTSPSSSGLDHLVEAATALTQLVRTGSNSNVEQALKSNQISDDEDNKSKQSSVASGRAVPANGNSSNINNSNLPPLPAVASIPVVAAQSAAATPVALPFKPTNENSKEIFPRRLLRILADPTISDIITWLPHGRAFVILKTDELAEMVLPKYFPESCSNANSKANSSKGTKSQTCKYPSFTRKLNRWGFRQVTRGPDSGAFHHKFFVREEPELCLKMVCQRTIKRNKPHKTLKKHTELKPARPVLGPYSAALRQQPAEAQWNGMSMHNKTFPPFVESEMDSSSSLNHNNKGGGNTMALKNLAMFQKRDEDQSTIISSRSSSCTSPSHNLAQINGGGSVSSLPSPSTMATQQHQHQAGRNPSPSSQMVRSVSTTSSIQPAGSLNANLTFPVFQGNSAQIDPRILLQHNFATNSFNAAASTTFNHTQTPAPAPTNITPATSTTATTNVPALPQLPQASTMPNYITLVDAKSVNPPQHVQQPQIQPHHQQQSMTTVPNHTQFQGTAVKFITPIVPVAPAPAINAQANNAMSTAAPTASTIQTVDLCKNNLNNTMNNAICATRQHQLQQQQLQQQQPRPQQTEAEVRVANAKSMLYKAFLEALG